jgi:hypothetical protein
MNKGGFSWKRATGVTRAKTRISRKTGIPLTKSGRQRKVGSMATGGGCLVPALMLLALVIGVPALAACGPDGPGAVPNQLVATPRAPTPTVRVTAAPTAKATKKPKRDVYYANCTEVRAAGKDPLRRGDPGYRSALDRDNDGVACE